MPDPTEGATLPEPAAPPPPRKRGLAWLAWIVILLLVGFEVLWPRLRPRRGGGAADNVRRIMADVQARQIVGLAELFKQSAPLYEQAKTTFDTGPVDDRLRFVVLAGDLQGPDEALRQLQRLREQMGQQGVEATERQQAVLAALDRLYRDRLAKTAVVGLEAVAALAGPDGQPWGALGSVAAARAWTRADGGYPPESLTDEDRELLRSDLRWCGDLALTPPESADREARAAVIGPARRSAGTFLAVLSVELVLAVLGLVGLVTLLAFFVPGHVRPALPPATRHGGIYAEAFAVYMVVFLGLSIGHAFLPRAAPELVLSGLAMLLSLAAGLFWPVLRGVPWRQVRQEVGLTLGRRPLLEPAVGVAGYPLILPVFGIGLIVTSVLINFQRKWQLGEHPEERFAPIEQPTHPIIEWLEHPNWPLLLQVIVIASVLAPLVEETMFRGVLYRHLRNATARWGRTRSFLASALVVSFIFAVIHPQGVLAVPALMSLAFGLNILREWRGSLLPSMIVHGIHNGVTTFLLVQALRG